MTRSSIQKGFLQSWTSRTIRNKSDRLLWNQTASSNEGNVNNNTTRLSWDDPPTMDERLRTEVKPISAMPGPKGLPVVGTMLDMMRYFGKWHLLNQKRFDEYGPLWRETIPQFGNAVMTADPRVVREIVAGDDPVPARPEIPLFLEYFKSRGYPLSILQATTKDWTRMRKAIDKPIMRPKDISKHVTTLADVSREFVDKLELARDLDGTVIDIEEEFFKWALESSTTVLFGRRMGCMMSSPPPVTKEFIDSVHTYMDLSIRLLMFPPALLRRLKFKKWEEFANNWDNIFRIVIESVDNKMSNLGSSDTDSFIGTILANNSVSLKELYTNISDLMVASIDTTTNSTKALLFELARNPEIQQKVYEEICRELPESSAVTYQGLKKLKYLKGAMKESHRLYPVGFYITRQLRDDRIIGGYAVPKGMNVIVTLYPLGRNPQAYSQPLTFRPERWLHGHDLYEDIDPFAWVPFGVGPRSCIGRRISNLEMELAVTEIVRRYRLSTTTPDLPLTTKFLLVADAKLKLKLTPR